MLPGIKAAYTSYDKDGFLAPQELHPNIKKNIKKKLLPKEFECHSDVLMTHPNDKHKHPWKEWHEGIDGEKSSQCKFKTKVIVPGFRNEVKSVGFGSRCHCLQKFTFLLWLAVDTHGTNGSSYLF